MPTYEYQCDTCNRTFDLFQSITADPITQCTFDNCNGNVRRLISPGAGLLFKGSGFYETDYRSDSYKKAAKAESGSKESSSPKEPSSKPAAPSTKKAD